MLYAYNWFVMNVCGVTVHLQICHQRRIFFRNVRIEIKFNLFSNINRRISKLREISMRHKGSFLSLCIEKGELRRRRQVRKNDGTLFIYFFHFYFYIIGLILTRKHCSCRTQVSRHVPHHTIIYLRKKNKPKQISQMLSLYISLCICCEDKILFFYIFVLNCNPKQMFLFTIRLTKILVDKGFVFNPSL